MTAQPDAYAIWGDSGSAPSDRWRPPRSTAPTVWVRPERRYPQGMAEDADQQESMTDALARVGIVVTAEGKARARAKLDEAAAKRTPERLAAMRALVGLPPLNTT